jgi:ABC-type amino acid transport substrate-binding protein
VLVRRGLPSPPRSITDLRKLQLCTERATTGSLLVASTIKPVKKPVVARNPSDLSYYLFTKRCDAIVFDAPTLAVLRRQAPDRYGPLAGRVVTNEKYAAAFEKGGVLRMRVNAVLGELAKDGSLDRLRKRWLGADTSALPILR